MTIKWDLKRLKKAIKSESTVTSLFEIQKVK